MGKHEGKAGKERAQARQAHSAPDSGEGKR